MMKKLLICIVIVLTLVSVITACGDMTDNNGVVGATATPYVTLVPSSQPSTSPSASMTPASSSPMPTSDTGSTSAPDSMAK